MTDFNLWTLNSRVFPGIDPLPVRLGDRVRVRIGNLTMTNHPIHCTATSFAVTCTDGGWIPESARWPEVTIDVPVGAMRAFEFVADEPGDWAFHCHKSHHTMNAMGHDVQNFIGVEQERSRRARSASSCPTTCRWARAGMAEMGEMEMPMPDNTLPMMTGFGQFGPIEMGGMFTVVKIREGLARHDYKDPGAFKHPEGTVAYEVTSAPRPSRRAAAMRGARRTPNRHETRIKGVPKRHHYIWRTTKG